MSRAPIAIAAAALLAVPVASAGAHDATPAGLRACGNQQQAGAGFFDVAAKRVRCRDARRIARRWSQRTLAGDTPRVVGRFRCRYREDHPDATYVSVRCARDGGRRVVRFHWGS